MEKHYIYFIGAVNPKTESLEAIKIGISNDPVRRIQSIITNNHCNLVLMSVIECQTEKLALEQEKKYHNIFHSTHIKGEWYSISVDLLAEIYGSKDFKRIYHRDLNEIEHRVLEIIKQYKEPFSLSDLRQKTRFITIKDQAEVLNTLEAKRYISVSMEKTKGRDKTIITPQKNV